MVGGSDKTYNLNKANKNYETDKIYMSQDLIINVDVCLDVP